ncbi:MAG TPA: tetratricopeptide repeat protein [Thermoanaerobaculia bacterium]|nr:tetratricopeptide repeat protein [Thermoanaerobaculia bacterium]
MARPRIRVLPLVLALAGLAAAGTAAAYLIRQNRDVTTSSEQALKLYHEGVENDLKMYERDAMTSYAEALRYDPNFVMATLRLADKMRARDPERAKSLLASAARHRDDLTPREQLVLSIYEERWGRRDMKRIEALVDEYVRRFPKDPEGYRMRADFLASTGHRAEALQEYERLIAVNPNYAFAYNELGYYWASKGDAAKAEDYLKRYRFLSPNDANPYDSLGELYAHTGRYDEAEENLKKALAIKSDFFASYGHLGTVEAGRGNYAKAAEWFRKAADETDQAETRYSLRFFAAVMLADAGRLDEALREMDAQAAETALLPDSADARQLRGQVDLRRAGILGRIGRTAEAEKILAGVDLSAFRDDKDPSKNASIERVVALIKGIIEAGAGRDAAAVALLKESLDQKDHGLGMSDYFPQGFFERMALAQSLGRLGRTDEAAEALAPILKENPRFAPALAVLARIRGEKPAAPVAAVARAAGNAS